MGIVGDITRYLGMGMWELPDRAQELQQDIDKAKLYFQWGKESGRKNDFYQSFETLRTLPNNELLLDQVFDKYEFLLNTGIEILSLELKESAMWFDFLTDNKLRIELREISFPIELEKKIGDFMNIEEKKQSDLDEIKNEFLQLEFAGEEGDRRQKSLQAFEYDWQNVNQGIEAFYSRVKEFIPKN